MTDREILERLIFTLCLADHLGDVKEAVDRAVQLANLPPPMDDDDEFSPAWADKPGLWS